MNKANMRLALKAFKGCKQHLNMPGEHDHEYFICRAITEWEIRGSWMDRRDAGDIARDIVMRSIAPSFVMERWVERNIRTPKMHIQARRHLFVDACIEELKRSIED